LKHQELLPVNSVSEYYSRANGAIGSKDFIRFDNANGAVDYYNPATRELVGLSPKGRLSTYHQVVNPAWVKTRNGDISSAGINANPRTSNPQTGLSSPTKLGKESRGDIKAKIN